MNSTRVVLLLVLEVTNGYLAHPTRLSAKCAQGMLMALPSKVRVQVALARKPELTDTTNIYTLTSVCRPPFPSFP